jgi:uncharacterized protein (DUF362 family)
MNKHINRREFVKQCTAAGAALVTAPSVASALETLVPAEKYTICAVVGDAYFDNTSKAVEALGGMKRFVKKGGTVGILINSPWGHVGTMTNPDIALAVVRMCLDAGAKQISTIHETSMRYWNRSALYETMKSEVDAIKYSDEKKEVTIDKGKTLKKAEISQTLLSCDTYINIPIIKDHEGTRFTCNMKNTMGACSSSTCRFFHYGGKFSLFSGAYSNVELLSQCIADVQLVRQPDLCIVDATEILTTNGPSGPGDLKKPKEVIAATNCVAADMYAVRHLGLNPDDLPVFGFVREHGLGPASLKDVMIKTI